VIAFVIRESLLSLLTRPCELLVEKDVVPKCILAFLRMLRYSPILALILLNQVATRLRQLNFFLVEEPIFTHMFCYGRRNAVGDSGFNFLGYKRHNFHILIDRLQTFYPASHPVIIYEAAQFPHDRCKMIKLSLESITKDDLTGVSLLYLPPAATQEIDKEMLRRLGL
jgi:hypothetical protein